MIGRRRFFKIIIRFLAEIINLKIECTIYLKIDVFGQFHSDNNSHYTVYRFFEKISRIIYEKRL